MNFEVDNPVGIIEEMKRLYSAASVSMDTIDGISISFDDWRFNLRASNTEPLLRLNVESVGNRDFLEEKLSELREVINGF